MGNQLGLALIRDSLAREIIHFDAAVLRLKYSFFQFLKTNDTNSDIQPEFVPPLTKAV